MVRGRRPTQRVVQVPDGLRDRQQGPGGGGRGLHRRVAGPAARPALHAVLPDALKANGINADVYDVDARGRIAPDQLGVLSHYDAAVWYPGDDIVTRPPEGVRATPTGSRWTRCWSSAPTSTRAAGCSTPATRPGSSTPEPAVSAPAVRPEGRDRLQPAAGGDRRATVPVAARSGRQRQRRPAVLVRRVHRGTRRRPRRGRQHVRRARDRRPVHGSLVGPQRTAECDNQDDTQSYLATSGILPPDQFKQFESWPSARWDKPGGPFAPHTGDQYVYSQIADVTYKRLARTITVPAGGATMSFWTSYDTEADWDYVFVEAHTVGQDDWTTLPDVNGHTSTGTGDSCPEGWNDLHPWLDHYQTLTTAKCLHQHWNDRRVERGQRQLRRLGAVVGQPRRLCRQAGRGVDHVRQRLGYPGARRLRRRHRRLDRRGQTSFEAGLDGWMVTGPPPGSAANANNWVRTDAAASRSERRSPRRARSSWASGSRASRRPLTRNAVMGRAMEYLLP